MSRSLVVALVMVFALIVAPDALAANTRYATPSPGANADCSAAKPCDLVTAFTGAAEGDTVVIGVGTYGPAAYYSDDGKNLDITGAVVGPGRPVVTGGFFLSDSSRISDVEIDGGELFQPLELVNGASADRVLAISEMADGCSISPTGSTITNSVCVSNNPESNSGLASQSPGGPMEAHNVTAIGHYGYFSNSTANPGLTLADSIAMTTDEDEGIDATFNQGLTIAINSYFATKDLGSGTVTETNQLAEAPTFRGPGDFREAPNSPTIDAGSNAADPNELDLNGNLRKIGSHTDVGAYEFVTDAPTASTSPASPIATTTATVNGTINPQSGQTYYHLEYGPTAAHGTSTPTQILPAATAPAAVHIDLTGFAPNSTVHYSLVATSEGGTATTPDATFVTNPLPPAAPSLTVQLVTQPQLTPSLRFKKEKGGQPKGQPLLNRPAIKLLVGCGPVACKATANGTVTIGGKRYGALRGPKKPTALEAGKQGTIKVRSSSSLRLLVGDYLLAHAGSRAKIQITATFLSADGTRAQRKLTIPVRPLG